MVLVQQLRLSIARRNVSKSELVSGVFRPTDNFTRFSNEHYRLRAVFAYTKPILYATMTRLRAAFIHFSLCMLVAAMLLTLFWFVWYPAPLFKAVGGDEIFLLLLGIDVALGPLMTLIVFKAGKKSLRFDLAVIAAVQFAALAYGVHTLLAGRPVYVAALGHRFDLIQANEIEVADLVKAGKSLPWFGPEWVGTRSPADAKERESIMFSGLGGADAGHFPQHHRPIEDMREELLRRAEPIASLIKLNPNHAAEIGAWLAEHRRTEKDTLFQGLKARSRDMAVMLDANTAAVIGIAPFRPWE